MHQAKPFSILFPFLLCCLVSFVFISCKKEVIPGIIDSGEGNPTSYLLEQITYGEKSGTNGSDFYFQYNTNNQVSEIYDFQIPKI